MAPSPDDRSPASPAANRDAGQEEIDRYLFEITYELAVSSLERVISPSLADFLA